VLILVEVSCAGCVNDTHALRGYVCPPALRKMRRGVPSAAVRRTSTQRESQTRERARERLQRAQWLSQPPRRRRRGRWAAVAIFQRRTSTLPLLLHMTIHLRTRMIAILRFPEPAAYAPAADDALLLCSLLLPPYSAPGAGTVYPTPRWRPSRPPPPVCAPSFELVGRRFLRGSVERLGGLARGGLLLLLRTSDTLMNVGNESTRGAKEKRRGTGR
jgi:hypothetical protein